MCDAGYTGTHCDKDAASGLECCDTACAADHTVKYRPAEGSMYALFANYTGPGDGNSLGLKPRFSLHVPDAEDPNNGHLNAHALCTFDGRSDPNYGRCPCNSQDCRESRARSVLRSLQQFTAN